MSDLDRRDTLALLASAAAFSASPALAAPATKMLRGAMPILTTPYMPDGKVDWDDIARECVFIDRCGCTGVIWPQNSSDVGLLSKDERMQGFEVLAKACKPLSLSLTLGVQAATTAEMLEYARHAEAQEPDALIAMPPSAEQTMDGYHAYFAALAGVTKRPVMVQTSLPGVRGALAPSLDLIFQLAREFPNLAYVKEEAQPLVERMRAELAQRPLMKGVFGASGGNGWLFELRLGLDGQVTAQGMYADVMAFIWNAYHAGRKEEAGNAYAHLLLMKNCEEQIPGTERYIFKKRGVFKSTTARKASGPVNIVLAPDAIEEIEFRYAMLKPYLAKTAQGG